MRTNTTASCVLTANHCVRFAAFLLLALIASPVQLASAVTIADFQFTGSSFASGDPGTGWGTSNLSTGAGLPLTTNAGGGSTGTIGNPIPAAEVQFSDLKNLINSAVPLSESLTFDNYYTFTVTPTPGASLNLSQLSFELAKTGGATVTAHVFSSEDGFAEIDEIDSFTFTAVSTLETATFDVSALADITTPIELRLYLSRASASTITHTIFTDNILLTGTVTLPPVPEPSSFLLLGLGALGLVRHTRRRRRRA